MATQLRPTGIDELGDQPWGTHFCLFYESPEDLLDLLIPYFKAGLEAHEYCLYVASEPVAAEAAGRALRQAVPNFEHYQSEGQIEIISHRNWYLAGGRFDPVRVRQGWIDKLDQALAHGLAGMRFAANTFWLERQDWAAFGEYEAQLDEVFGQLRILAVCAYALQKFTAPDLLDVVHHHQFAVARRHGAWERLEGSELARAQAEIRGLNADLERQVKVRTAQLAATNEHLKREVAERQRNEEALRKSERVLREAESLGHTGSWEQDLVTGEIFNTEENLRLFFGDDRSKGTPFEDYSQAVHPDDRDYVMRRHVQLLAEGGPSDIEFRVVWPDGSVHVLFGRATVVRNELGQAIRVYGTNLEITERKQAEEALRRSEAEYRALADNSVQGITIYQDDKIVYTNPAVSRMLGYTAEEFKGMSVEQIIALTHPVDRLISVERARKRMAGEALPPSVEIRIVRKDGSMGWVQAFIDSIEYLGRPAVISTVIDITERKQAEDALRRSEDQLRRVIDTIPVMAWTVQPDGTVDYLSQRWIDYTGLALEQYVAEPTRPIHPEDIPRGIENWLAATAAGEPYEAEMRLQGADGEYRWFLIRTEPLRDEAGKIVKWYGVSTDIDDRKRAEGEVNRQAARAETLARTAGRLNKNLELEAVVQAVCEEAINTFKVSQAAMTLYDKERDLLVYAGGVNIPPEYSATMESVSRSRFDEFLRTMGPVMVVPDMQAVPNAPNVEYSSHQDVRTTVTAAMFRDQDLVGSLTIGVNGHVREFSQDELTLLKAVSDLAAQAIANAQLLKEANEQQEQLRALGAKLAEAQEAERRAVARELHDEIGQLLYAVGANLEAIQISADPPTLAGRLADSAALVDEAIQHVRDLALELRPSMLDDFGLAPALTWLVERQAQRSDFKVEFAAEPLDLRLAPSLETAIYRIVQIALTNVARHAQAHKVDITLRLREAQVELLICDDGLGFDVAAALERATHGATLGLLSMQERVRLAGGTLDLHSSPGHGTEIQARFPIGR